MRQFVFGVLVAAFVWWGYGLWSERPAAAGESGADGTTVGKSASLGDVLPVRSADPGAAEGAAISPTPTAPKVAVGDLAAGVSANDPRAVAAAWAALAGGAAALERPRLVAMLTAGADDLAAVMARLGDGNGFLHSAEGRTLAGKALELALARPDGEALLAATQLLDRCLRGSIEKGDVAARQFVDEAYQKVRVRIDRWLCDPTNVQGARSCTVQSGDSLVRIAGRFRKEQVLVEDGTLAVLNRIHNPNTLQVGQKLKIPVDPIRAVVEKRSYSLCIYVGEYLLRMYWCGHGENDKTPVTDFVVGAKQPRPEWTAPDGNVYPYGHPKNILGEYFIKLLHPSHTGFGVHGTPLPDTIGTMSSMGCIRLVAADIAEVAKILPMGVTLTIRASEARP